MTDKQTIRKLQEEIAALQRMVDTLHRWHEEDRDTMKLLVESGQFLASELKERMKKMIDPS